MIYSKAASLHDLLAGAGVPVVTVRQTGDTFEAVYDPSATQQQRYTGDGIVARFDASDAAEQARQDIKKSERVRLKQIAGEAVSDNAAYLALVTPNAKQMMVQVKALTQQNNAIIKRLLQISEREQ